MKVFQSHHHIKIMVVAFIGLFARNRDFIHIYVYENVPEKREALTLLQDYSLSDKLVLLVSFRSLT